MLDNTPIYARQRSHIVLERLHTFKSHIMAQAFPQAVLISDLVGRATEFTVAYSLLTFPRTTTRPPDWPRYFLLSHSIELSLKAFLAARGKTSVELRKEFGHDLKKLLKEAIKRGLVLGPEACEAIFILEKAHNNHWARYPKEDSTPVVAIEEFEKTAFELLHQVRETIYPAISI
jgi:HEPN domain-containing protein